MNDMVIVLVLTVIFAAIAKVIPGYGSRLSWVEGPFAVLKVSFVGSALLVMGIKQFENTKMGLEANDRAEFIESLERQPIFGSIPNTMVSFGELHARDQLRLFARYGISEFFVYPKNRIVPETPEFNVVSVLPHLQCYGLTEQDDPKEFQLWEIRSNQAVCLRTTKRRIPVQDLPQSALYFSQGTATTFAEGAIGPKRTGLHLSRQYELRVGRAGRLVDYYESGEKVHLEMNLHPDRPDSHESRLVWRFLQKAIDPNERFGPHDEGYRGLNPKMISGNS